MSQSFFRKSTIAVAVLSLSASMGVLAQGIAGGGSSGGSGPSGPGAGVQDRAGGARGTADRPMSGESARSARSDASDSVTRGDRKFIEKAAMDGMAEVELGRLAQQKASNAQVKQFAAQMVDDHSKANERLREIAQGEGVELPTKLDSKHERTLEKLQKLSGAEFDREYMKEMRSEHKKDVSEFEKAAKSAKDPQVKNFATQTLPKLQEHHQMAESIWREVDKGSTLSMRSQSSPQPQSRPASPSQNR